jgi:hypothetical protein
MYHSTQIKDKKECFSTVVCVKSRGNNNNSVRLLWGGDSTAIHSHCANSCYPQQHNSHTPFPDGVINPINFTDNEKKRFFFIEDSQKRCQTKTPKKNFCRRF